MENGETLKVFVSRYAGDVFHLIHDDGVGDIGLFQANHLGHAVGNQTAEVAGVNAVIAFQQVLLHQVVDTIHSGGERFDETAATHHDGDFVQVDVLVLQFFQNEILAVVVLVGKNCEFRQLVD